MSKRSRDLRRRVRDGIVGVIVPLHEDEVEELLHSEDDGEGGDEDDGEESE